MKVHSLKALKDNYIFILENSSDKNVIVIDPSEAQPVVDFCETHQLRPTHIINTHHHYDHVGGNLELQKRYDLQVLCYTSDSTRTPAATHKLDDAENITIGDWSFQVLHIPGHTLGQIALYSSAMKCVFVGDTLFRYGCGRLFEGDAGMMYQSLQKLKKLPPETLVYCGHEYGLRNLEFVQEYDTQLSTEQYTSLKSKMEAELASTGQAVPFTLEEQKEFSPFLRATSAEEFKKWRDLRDTF